MRLVVRLFGSRDAAEDARDRLIDAGLSEELHLLAPAQFKGLAEPADGWGGVVVEADLHHELVALGVPNRDAEVCAAALERGSTLVAVRVAENNRTRAETVLDRPRERDRIESLRRWRGLV